MLDIDKINTDNSYTQEVINKLSKLCDVTFNEPKIDLT